MRQEAILTKERLDQVIFAIKKALCDPELRKLSQRGVQAKIWHLEPTVANLLSELRSEENEIRGDILRQISMLVYKFHNYTLDSTLMRAGVVNSDKVHAGSSLSQENKSFDLICLDAKERLYMMLKEYDWLKEFFALFPLHFYENSFSFISRIPMKRLPVKIKVIGMGIGGSMCVSGLAKAGIRDVEGFEKRPKEGISSVGSRYQNASWRAYEVAEELLDQEATDHLLAYRQRLNVTFDDGTTGEVTSDRVQIILGSAIEACIGSAERYGAKLHFGVEDSAYMEKKEEEKCDIVVLFCGAHTSSMVSELPQLMNVISGWPELTSHCNMFLKIYPSVRQDFFCTRYGEIGAENWHYTIESARDTTEDIVRVKNALAGQYKRRQKRGLVDEKSQTVYEARVNQLEKTLEAVGTDTVTRFDYVFTNCPDNPHNRKKQAVAEDEGTVVLDGTYDVDIQIVSNSAIWGEAKDEGTASLLGKFNTELVVTGGDACVPPNPQAAYGATLACESAQSIVRLAVATGHINAMVEEFENTTKAEAMIAKEWIPDVNDLKNLLREYYVARSRSENYFQMVQTVICNCYSLPPFET